LFTHHIGRIVHGQHVRLITTVTIVLTLLAACGKAEHRDTPVPPTATPVPSTDTPISETASPSPEPSPTATTIAPTATPAPTATTEPVSLPAFQPANCQFEREPGYNVECGFLIVPEDRGQPDGPTIKMHVAVFKSTNTNPAPDPVIHLAGGPGSNLLDGAIWNIHVIGNDILQTRDYILFNQRGTHYAEPSLECPGYVRFFRKLTAQNLSHKEQQAQEIEFLLGCHDDLLEQGINLSAYNSAENASDVNDLRIALGYDEVNLYGVSYGTRLALTVMRDHPEGIRSAVIDSVYPPQIGGYSERASGASYAFDTLFAGCAADPECNQTYPDLEATFYQTVDELNANPVTLTVSGHPMTVDGKIFVETIFVSMYRIYPYIPRIIADTSLGEYTYLIPELESLVYIGDSVGISFGMYYSTQCREEVAFESYQDALALAADVPSQLADVFATSFRFDLCESWESGIADPIENEPIVSDIPTLVVVGQYDPIAIPPYGKLVAETLSNSFFYEFPGLAHNVIQSDVMRSNRCGLDIALAFLNDPTTEPDTSCIDELAAPDFQ
jgi:pimeloyl-ACP methyl ester carboxylesterase